MSTINRLSSVDALQPGDLIPVWDGSNGDTRKASMSTLLAYIESNFADPDYTTRVVAPSANGFNVDAGDTGTSLWLIINPLAAYASGSISLPAAAFAANDQEVVIVFTQSVASFSITSAGATIENSPTVVNTYDSFRFRYNASQLTWYRLDSAAITADLVAYMPAGTGAVETTVQAKLRQTISVQDFGAVGDGITDDTAAIKAAADAMTSGQSLDFGSGTYLVSQADAGNADAYGKKIMNLSGLRDISIIGQNATIKCVDHDINNYGGLLFLNVSNCKRVHISGLYFEMNATGRNTTDAAYPFFGAIVGADTPGAFTTICSDWLIEDCKFKIFHPFGQLCTSGSSYNGDPNNGFKAFSIFVSGIDSATAYDDQNRNITIRDVTFLNGHNAYAIWVWAWNNIIIDGMICEAYVGKGSDNAGVLNYEGLAAIRYHQWYCQGIVVTNCHFRAKPSAERTGGFEGGAKFIAFDTNNTTDLSNGYSIASNNTILLSNGDAANSVQDFGIQVYCYGDVIIEGNIFDGDPSPTNAIGSSCVTYNGFIGGGVGHSTFSCNDNIFGSHLSYAQNIVFSNGSSTSDATRRCKVFQCTGNVSASQQQYFLYMVDPDVSYPYGGCQLTIIANNIIDGTLNTLFDKNSTSSRGIGFSGTGATDQIIIKDNQFRAKYYGIYGTVGSSAEPDLSGNSFVDVTSDYSLGGAATLSFQSGQGVDFAKSALAGATKTVLTAYEERTFTPVVKDGPAGNIATAAIATGRVTKIGRIAHFELNLTNIDTSGLTAGNGIYITGFPFTKVNDGNFYASYIVSKNSVASTEGVITGTIVPNTAYMTLNNQISGAAGLTTALVSQITSGSGDLNVVGSYEVQ